MSYKAIKKELFSEVEKFGMCRDEFILCLRDEVMRAVSLKAMQEIFIRVEDWYCR